jgi:hypothetical protein
LYGNKRMPKSSEGIPLQRHFVRHKSHTWAGLRSNLLVRQLTFTQTLVMEQNTECLHVCSNFIWRHFQFVPLSDTLIRGCIAKRMCCRDSESLRNARYGDRIPMKARFSAPAQTGLRAHTASWTIVNRFPFLAVKREERGVGHPPSSSAEVKERVQLHLYPHLGLRGVLQGEVLLFLKLNRPALFFHRFYHIFQGTLNGKI